MCSLYIVMTHFKWSAYLSFQPCPIPLSYSKHSLLKCLKAEFRKEKAHRRLICEPLMFDISKLAPTALHGDTFIKRDTGLNNNERWTAFCFLFCFLKYLSLTNKSARKSCGKQSVSCSATVSLLINISHSLTQRGSERWDKEQWLNINIGTEPPSALRPRFLFLTSLCNITQFHFPPAFPLFPLQLCYGLVLTFISPQ